MSKKHEGFDITNLARKRHVRQDRIEGEFYLSFGDQRLLVANMSSFGVALKSDQTLPEDILDATIEVSGLKIGEVNLKKVRNESDLQAYAIIGHPIDIDVVLGLEEVNHAIKDHQAHVAEVEKVEPAFRGLVADYKNWFSDLEQRINALQKSTFEHDKYLVELFEDVVSTRVAQYLEPQLKSAYSHIELYMAKLNPDEMKTCIAYFRSQLTPILHQSSYAHRAYTKPKGYAGDYEMMNHAYLAEVRGDTLFGKCLQKYYVEAEASQAVRNRGDYMREKMENVLVQKKKAKFLAVASGPAMELQGLLDSKPHLFGSHEVEFHLMDQDLDALKHSQRKLDLLIRKHNIKNVKIIYHNLAVKNVIARGFPETDFDLIYSAGLFDYLGDPVAEMTAKQLMASLKTGGRLVIGNFSTENSSRTGMELIMDWYLIHRSPVDLQKLFGSVSNQISVESEPLGINLFAVLTKT